MKVLIVDDANILRIVLKDILVEFCKIKKADIFEAYDGKQAIEEYKKVSPRVVFLDTAMPDPGSRTAVETILALDTSAHIILCSAAKDIETVRECILAGAKDFLAKPLMPARVVEAMKNL